mgnify:CR=1 FL=1
MASNINLIKYINLGINKRGDLVSYIFPFSGVRNQKIGSIITIFVGAFLMLSSVPFIIEFGKYAIPSTILGFVIAMVGLGYFLHSVS